MGKIWEKIKKDFKAIPPKKIQIYDDDESGVFAYHIENRENDFVPKHVRVYQDNKKTIIDASDEPSEFMEKLLCKESVKKVQLQETKS